jgi:hypothetical protein
MADEVTSSLFWPSLKSLPQIQSLRCIHFQHGHGGATDSGSPDYERTTPLKVILPCLQTWIEYRSNLAGYRIETGEVGTFVSVAMKAGPGQIIGTIPAAVFSWHDMFNVKKRERRFDLLQLAVFATKLCTLLDRTAINCSH